jgi:hypothetical protein
LQSQLHSPGISSACENDSFSGKIGNLWFPLPGPRRDIHPAPTQGAGKEPERGGGSDALLGNIGIVARLLLFYLILRLLIILFYVYVSTYLHFLLFSFFAFIFFIFPLFFISSALFIFSFSPSTASVV